ncbi:hypothetical protein K525DRAFT_283624 [Schizophyllum commune Loenen D]|nr:hypothetical protein K525DRAFT_283624 [Schizophyllum commune Loenen D]
MADCVRSCGRPSVGKSTNHTLNKDTTGTSHRLACPSSYDCPSPATTVIRVHGGSALAFVTPGEPSLYFGTRVLVAPGCVLIIGRSTPFQRFADWSTVVGSISRQTLRRPRRTAMTPVTLLPSL